MKNWMLKFMNEEVLFYFAYPGCKRLYFATLKLFEPFGLSFVLLISPSEFFKIQLKTKTVLNRFLRTNRSDGM